jgi:hypothetical protein
MSAFSLVEMGVSWSQTNIFWISSSRVARITGQSHCAWHKGKLRVSNQAAYSIKNMKEIL